MASDGIDRLIPTNRGYLKLTGAAVSSGETSVRGEGGIKLTDNFGAFVFHERTWNTPGPRWSTGGGLKWTF